MFSFRLVAFLLVGAGVFLFDISNAKPWGDFETIVRNYANKLAKENGLEVEWVDAFGRHPHLRQNPKYRKYQASARVIGDVQYGTTTTNVSRPAWKFTQWFHNSMSLPMISAFHKVKTEEDEFSWSVDANLIFAKDKVKKNFTFMIPPQLGLDRKNYTKEFKADQVMYGKGQKMSFVKYDKFNISQEITIPANKSIESTLVIQEREVTIPWSAEVEISGSFAVWFKRKWNGHWLWFFPVQRLSRENPHFKAHFNGLRYTQKGSFSGVFSTTAHLHLREYDLKRTGGFRDVVINHVTKNERK